MLVDDLIEKLYENKRRNGNLEVKLYTRRDAWSWEQYDIEKIYCSDDTYTGDYAIIIEGEDRRWDSKEEENKNE